MLINRRYQLWVDSEDNLNPGVAIAKCCRAAEAHPNSHPTGQNLLLFLEKDWNIISGDYQEKHIEQLFYFVTTVSNGSLV